MNEEEEWRRVSYWEREGLVKGQNAKRKNGKNPIVNIAS
jgi:hypothetical protein